MFFQELSLVQEFNEGILLIQRRYVLIELSVNIELVNGGVTFVLVAIYVLEVEKNINQFFFYFIVSIFLDI